MKTPSKNRTSKTPPLNNLEAEQVIIGSILLNSQCFDQVKRELVPEDFDLEKHRVAYETLLNMADEGKPLQLSVLISTLSDNGGLAKVGGQKYLVDLVGGIATSAVIDYHVREVKDMASLRNLNLLLLKGQDTIKDKNTFDEIVAQVQEGLDKLKETYKPGESLYIGADELLSKEFKRSYVIGKGILPDGGGLILAGESGVGKSILRTEIAIHLAMGWAIYELPVNEKRKILIIQFENPEPTEQYRLKQMLKAFQIESLGDRLKFSKPTVRFDLKLKKDRLQALSLVKDSGADIIIWDPLSSLHQGNENDNIQMRTVLDTITEINRKTGTSAIVLHHWGKPQEGREDEYRLRGAISIKDWADTVIQMSRKKHKSKILHYLSFTKIRNGPERRPILIEADKGYFTHAVREEDTLASPEKVAEVLEDLGGEVGTQVELIEALIKEVGCSDRSAKKYIKNAIYKTIKEYDTGEKTKGYVLFN